ncbi:DNA excision repair protein ERCC-6 [Araneus ventricosus]|uniref:DNA excision repair protein ERCC-6 n=1 Tax=Araneus ventricosus TaxID=182803 RepID=A0A4Y2BHS0_ARAVE|nr:DNA excision repair protein ERCC-6 [Araneus ventricosus]
MENVQDLEDETDSDVSIFVPLNDQLKICSDLIAEEHSLSCEALSKDLNSGDNCASEPASDNAVPCSSKSDSFRVTKESIPCVPEADQEKELIDLGVSVYDQTQFETEVIAQVDKALKDQEERKRTEVAKKELHIVEEDIRFVKTRLNQIEKALSMAPKDENSMTNAAKRELSAIKKEKENKLMHMKKLEAKHKALQMCISGSAEEVNAVLQNNVEGSEEQLDEETVYHLKQVFTVKETEEEKMIRTGEMTPFGTIITNQAKDKPKPRKIIIPTDGMTDFDKFLLNEAENHMTKTSSKNFQRSKPSSSKSVNKVVIKSQESSDFKGFTDLKAISSKKNKTLSKVKLGSKFAKGFSKTSNHSRSLVKNYRSDSELSDVEDDDKLEIKDDANNYSSDDVYIPDENDLDDEYEESSGKTSKKKKTQHYSKKTRQISADSLSDTEDEDNTPKKKLKKLVDDGNQESYIKRIKALEKSEWMQKQMKLVENEGEDSDEEDVTEFDEGYKIPNRIWNKLYKFQKTAVRWLWELHQQNCGGIIGDEMGLGKTIQIIAFLIGLKFSNLTTVGDYFKGLGPVILICPATVMHQWLKEFYTWWPYFRVAILHESGSFVGKKDSLIRIINKSHGVLITTYNGVVQHQENLLKHEWHYVILDEGHKIRNPDSQATLAVKQFRTPHRIILSGSPIQNNLKELWSLFDFIFPGKLGTLPVFMQQFSVPIVLGGYANASQIQVQTAYKCATVLRDAIKPYLLRRMKSDVKMSVNLPDKNEQVLFCKLTEDQENLYKAYISSKEVGSILNARLQVFVGLINLRKICNHPDIFDGGPKIFKDTDLSQLSEEEHYGYYKRSGKMIVVEALLRLWHKQGHRVLLFTQSRQMLQIFEIFVKSKNYTYMKMDGSTSISSRQPAVAKFNSDSSIFVFLLTTRVGGLGVNLTGANRVILYDPDWNPSTDVQARERAWRIGQNKQVTIYRLMTAGTIEEKIYHRQIFKQFVTNRVLKDPKQRRFFKSNDLYELFTYNEVGHQGTETSCIFAGTGSEIKLKKKFQRPNKSHKKEPDSHPVKSSVAVSFTEEKKEQMRMLAKKLSLELAKTSLDSKSGDSKPAEQKTVKNNSDEPVLKISLENKNGEKPSKTKVQEATLNKAQKRKASKIEGEKIDYVVKKSVYKTPENEEDKTLNEDDYVLSKLFKKSGVHTALKHDVIVESSTPDYSIVEGEANRVATEAIKALKKSRQMCARASEGIPTWTGQHGGFKPRFGQKKKLPVKIATASSSDRSSKSSSKNTKKHLKFDGKKDIGSCETASSSDLLSAIRNRKVVFGTNNDNDDENESGATPSIPRLTSEHDELLADLRNYIAFEGAVCGQATTKELIDAFKEKVPVTQTAIFKALLNKLCNFSRTSGEGTWYLKSEFR